MWHKECPNRGGRGLPHSQQLWNQCRNVLLMSQLQFPWERGDRHQRCKKAQWSVAEALESVRKLQQSRPDRRAVRIVFIGDSRVRNLHSTLVKELGLRPDNASTVPMFYNEVFHPREQLRRAVPPQQRLPGLRAGCTEVDVMRPDGQDRVRCSLAAGAASLRSEFWVFVFRAELAAAAGRLARLADATRLLWKLDEQYMPEVAYGRKMNVTGAMMVLSSVVHETAARIPRLSAWSSGLAETTHFYHQVCLPHGRQLRQFTYSPLVTSVLPRSARTFVLKVAIALT
ncbi:hypothetical protein FJT64_023995 [Amphibalanus amphitrite]|uniref:Uncharacterized protein n=1 Tax=Amphibalanus amphitrite TaxID=1232801 RepID=A0A6A4WDN1_AMPAM|nr:hypothetical protein FJT64_023995 [Amphibalanus amphitrite]